MRVFDGVRVVCIKKDKLSVDIVEHALLFVLLAIQIEQNILLVFHFELKDYRVNRA